LDVKSVDGLLSFRLRADFSIGLIQSEPLPSGIENDAGEITYMLKYDISMPIHHLQAFHSMIR
jgi:hypothetical protein